MTGLTPTPPGERGPEPIGPEPDAAQPPPPAPPEIPEDEHLAVGEPSDSRGDGPAEDHGSQDAAPAESASARPRWRKVTRRSVAALVLLFLAAMAGLSQTRNGQRLVLDAVLDRVRGSLAGELTVGGIRSGTLLTGATLSDVRLDAADGATFLVADSVVLRYSLPAVLVGGPPIRSTTLWGVDVEISRAAPGEPLNVEQLLAEPEPDSASVAPGQPVALGHIGVRSGTLRFLTPDVPGSRAPMVVDTEGRRWRQLSLQDLDLDLEGTQLRRGAPVTLEAGLASLSGSVHLVERPLVLREVFGVLTYGAQGIRIVDAAFRLPSTLLRGQMRLGPDRPGDPWTVATDLTVDGWGDLRDLAWVDSRIPPGRFRGAFAVDVPDLVEVTASRFEAELEASTVLADGWVRFDDATSLRSMRVTASPLAVERLEPWLGFDIPFDGWLSGQATFSGSLRDLGAIGRMTLIPTGYGGSNTTADVSGIFHLGDDPGGTDLDLGFENLNYTVLQAFWPNAPISGEGDGRLRINGRATGGVALDGYFTHGADSSRVDFRGLARRMEDGEWTTDVRGELSPLSIGILGPLAPGLELRGALAGGFRVSGRLDGLTVTGDLVTPGGGVVLDGSFDLRNAAAPYRLEAEADGLPLSSLSGRLPDRSAWTGRLLFEGRGLALESMDSRATLIARDSRVGPVFVDTVAASFRVARGILVTDTLDATVGGIDVDGRGRFGLAPGTFGTSRFTFEGETLAGLRSLAMGLGDTVLVRDELGELDRAFLRASGVEPDTLPSALDVRMEGEVSGGMSISGEAREFDLGLVVDVAGGAYRHNQVDAARIALTATGLPGTAGTWGVGASARGVVWEDRAFEQGDLEAEMTERAGRGRIELVRAADERYRLAGSFRLGSPESELEIEEGQVQVGESFWNLTRPSRVAWDDRSLEVDSLRVTRADEGDPMSLTAHGILTRGGQSDFRLALDGFHVEQLFHVAQIDDIGIEGHVDLELAVSGPSESPVIGGRFSVDGPRYGAMELTRLDGSLDYRNRVVTFGLQGWDGGRDAIDASGTFPVDLALATVDERVLERPMEIAMAADSLDAAIALSYLTSLEQVIGTITGEVLVRGTPSAPAPEGVVTLTDAEWSVEAIGVRHTEVEGTLTLNPDRTVDVRLTSTGSGRSDVTGTIVLSPFDDPAIDLSFDFSRFQAVDRADVEGRITGSFDLQGSYRRPVAEGDLTVDDGTIYVDEFQRVAGVVDLSDPLLFEGGLGVDTTALLAQPLVSGLRNPFFDNLRVDINLAVPRNTWLRSIDTNVEMAGALDVAYDRLGGDLVLVGELEAVRGSHRVLGRTFDLDGGTVVFLGQPGLNPQLNIQASAPIRRRNQPDLDVQASVSGTLIQPVVTLSTDEAGVGEADLVSYLIFGQPTATLGTAQTDVAGQVGSAAISTLGSGGLTYLGGTLANQFTAALAQGTGIVDYLSVQLSGESGGFSQLGSTVFEAGRYLGRDVFAVLVFQLARDDAETNLVGGARVEWSVTDDYVIEGFLEDRYLRSGSAGFLLPGVLDDNQIVGVFVFRDWGY